MSDLAEQLAEALNREGAMCGQPTESEPCPDHQSAAAARRATR